MAFWGVEVKNGDPFTHRFDVERGRLHISQATLGDGSSTKRSLVQCKVGSRKPILMCSLLPDKAESCPLDLEFEEVDDVVFSVVGPRSVHLTGYYLGNGTCGHYDDSDSYGEDIAGTETEESTDYDTEEEYDDDFIDDGDLEVFPPSPIPNSGVVIEEIFDDEKPLKENGSSKHIKKPRPGDSDDSNNSQQQIVVKGSTGVPVLESEDEDGFPISSPSKSNSIVQNTEEVKEKREKREKRSIKEGKKKKKKTKDDGDQGSSLKRKIESVVQDGNPESGAGQPYDLSVPSTDVNSESHVKPKKKKKEPANKGKILEAGKDSKCSFPKEDIAQAEEVKADNMDHDLPVSNELEQELPVDKSLVVNDDHAAAATPQSGEKKKKKKKKNKIQETDMEVLVKEESDTDVKASQVRTFPNGLVIEELAMGKPDGKRASPGKKVAVHYIGKLKKNGQIFDSNIGKAPFKFRLGVGQVIKGWDVGVNGMRIGDKRRLTIPPSMGYGSQGAGKKIPPNSWLLFDVELVDANN